MASVVEVFETNNKAIMKKILVTLALFGFALTGYSQNISFGPKVGLSQTNLDLKNQDFDSGDGQVGYHLGVFARIGAAGFFVQPEVLFTQTSGRFTYSSPSTGSESQFDANFNRLDIPIMAGFKIFNFLRLQAGPIASIDINSELRDAGNTVRDADFNQSSIGYQAGLGLDIGNLIIDGKYESSLGKITDNVGNYSTDNRISQWILSVGFKIF